MGNEPRIGSGYLPRHAVGRAGCPGAASRAFLDPLFGDGGPADREIMKNGEGSDHTILSPIIDGVLSNQSFTSLTPTPLRSVGVRFNLKKH